MVADNLPIRDNFGIPLLVISGGSLLNANTIAYRVEIRDRASLTRLTVVGDFVAIINPQEYVNVASRKRIRYL